MEKQIRLKKLEKLAATLMKITLALIFLYAGTIKAVETIEFADTLMTYEIINKQAIVPIAITLPFIEIIIALMLFSKRPSVGAMGMSILLFVFIMILSIAKWNGVNVDCGCFGSTETKTEISIIKNIILILLSAWIYRLETKQLSTEAAVEL